MGYLVPEAFVGLMTCHPNNIVIILLLASFFTPVSASGLSLEYPQVSRTLLSIQTDLNNAMFWMVSILLLISIYTSLLFFFETFKSCSKACSTIGIIVTRMFHCLFLVLRQGPSIYLSFSLLWFLLGGLPGRQNPRDKFFFFFSFPSSLSLDFRLGLGHPFVFQNLRLLFFVVVVHCNPDIRDPDIKDIFLWSQFRVCVT